MSPLSGLKSSSRKLDRTEKAESLCPTSLALAFLRQISRHIWPVTSQSNLKTRMTSKIAGIEVPVGFRLHTENTSHVLLSSDEAFLNPVQEFNRDLSVACIRVWSEETDSKKEVRWRKAQEKKAKHKFISNQKGSHIHSFSKTIKNIQISEEPSPLARKDVERASMIDNIPLPSDATSSNISELTEVNVSMRLP